MKVTIDHIGIAVSSLEDALAFYRDALGLVVEAPEEVPSQRVRAHFIPAGETRHRTARSHGRRFADREVRRETRTRPPPHHASCRRHRGSARAAESARRPAHRRHAAGGGTRVARGLHPPIERARRARRAEAGRPSDRAMTFGDLELIPLLDGFFRLDGGAMFGVVPKPLWERRAAPDEKNRIRLGLRPLARARRKDDDHRRGDRRQDGREELRHLRHRSRPRPRCVAGGGRADGGRHRDRAGLAPPFRSCRRLHEAGRLGRADALAFRTPGTSCGPPSGRTPRTRTSATGPAICPRTSSR